jgi:mannitol-1-phosphate 5-dehydrogenase
LELTRKVYTYNAINAVISYIGHLKGYQLLSEAASDSEIHSLAEQAGMEASAALVAAHGFNIEEQEKWVKRALSKYQDERIVDPIARQCRDPMRKLGENDRLLGPILLCKEHGIPCEALKVGLAAALQYDPDEEESERDASIAELRKLRSSSTNTSTAGGNLLSTQEILDEMGFKIAIGGAEITLERVIRLA